MTVAEIRNEYEKSPRKMTVQLARELGVAEAEVIRALPDGMAVELKPGESEKLLRAMEGFGQVHVIVTNGAATLESFGTFGNFSSFGEYFNVQSKSLDMHIRFQQIGAIFAVEKPGHMDGVKTLSFQFYDRSGAAAFKVFLSFGSKPAPADRQERFALLREQFRL
jgi:putative heme utilization carrier protein HutX